MFEPPPPPLSREEFNRRYARLVAGHTFAVSALTRDELLALDPELLAWHRRERRRRRIVLAGLVAVALVLTGVCVVISGGADGRGIDRTTTGGGDRGALSPAAPAPLPTTETVVRPVTLPELPPRRKEP